MPDRRTFLISLSGVVAAPVFAQFSLPATAARQVQWTAGDAPGSIAPVVVPSPAEVALRIDGWEAPGSGPELWIQIKSSWRATWR
jgi:hypothetical protein